MFRQVYMYIAFMMRVIVCCTVIDWWWRNNEKAVSSLPIAQQWAMRIAGSLRGQGVEVPVRLRCR